MILFITACSSTDLSFEISTSTSGEKDQTEDTGSLNTQETSSEPITFYKDIRPILDQSCNACHWESGRSFNMITHTYPLVWSSIIARDIVDGGKPPPTPNPTCREYVGGDWHLTDVDIQTIVDWVDLGSPIGFEEDAPTYTHWPTIGPFDQEYSLSETIQVPLNEGYRCYAYPIENQVGLKGLQMTTNNEEYIHHSLVYLSSSNDLPNNPADFECTYSGNPNWDLVAGWRPGAPPMELENGIILENQDYVVVQTYYTPPIEPDPSEDFQAPTFSWGALFSSEPDIQVVSTEIEGFVIPAGSSNHQESGSYLWQGETADLVGLMPRTHLLGTGVSASILYEDGNEDCLLTQDGYDFGMPHNILFVDPPSLSNNDVLSYQCSWDNSSGNMRQNFQPPINVVHGTGRNDGVCRITLFVR